MPRRRRRFGSIRKLPSGRFQARFKDHAGDEHTASETFASKGDADRYLAAVETDLGRGVWLDPRKSEITFAVWMGRYLRESTHKRATTLARDKSVLETHFAPILGGHPMGTITKLDVRRTVDRMKDRGLAASTVRTNYGVLKALFAAAVEAEILGTSPCGKLRQAAPPYKAKRMCSEEELERLAAAMPAQYGVIVYVAGVLGLRWSEVAGLRVGAIDFLRKRMSVVETIAEVEGRLIAAPVKSKASRRTFSVPPSIIEMLSRHLAAAGQHDASAYVFGSPGGGPLRYTTFRNRVWRPAVGRAGLDGLVIHALRHTAAGLMRQQGVPVSTIAKRLGHSSEQVTATIYGWVPEALDEAAADALEGLFAARNGTPMARPKDS